MAVVLLLATTTAEAAWIFEGQVHDAPTGSYAKLYKVDVQIGDSSVIQTDGRYYFGASSGLFLETDTAIVRVFNSTGQSLGETHLPGNLRQNTPVNWPVTITAGAPSNVTAYDVYDVRNREGLMEAYTLVDDGRYLLVDTINEHYPFGTLEPYIHELDIALPNGTRNFNIHFIKREGCPPGYCWADSTGWMQVTNNGPFGPNVQHLTPDAYSLYYMSFNDTIHLPRAGIAQESESPSLGTRLPTHLRLAALFRLLESLPDTEVYDAHGRRIETPKRGVNFVRFNTPVGKQTARVVGI